MKINYCLWLIMLFNIFTSCTPDECDTVIVEKVSNVQSIINPYSGYDTLFFLHNSMDTLVYVGQGVQYYEANRVSGDDENCTRVFEGVKLVFYCEKNASTIHFTYSPYVSTEGYRYYYNNIYAGGLLIQPLDSVNINNRFYKKYFFWTEDKDTSQYFMMNGDESVKEAIIKIKYPSDVLTLLK